MSTASAAALIPEVIWIKLRDFTQRRATGALKLNIRDGRIMTYELIEAGRIEGCESAPPSKIVSSSLD